MLSLICASMPLMKAAQSSEEPLSTTSTKAVPGVGLEDVLLGETLDQFFRDYKLAVNDKIITFESPFKGKMTQVKEIMYDENSGGGTPMHTLDLMFVAGKLTQISTNEHDVWVSAFGRHRPSLSEALLRAPNAHVSAYTQYNNDPGGEFGRYYYDNVREGIAFVTDSQDPSATSDEILGRNLGQQGKLYPDWIVVHRPASPVIPLHSTDHRKVNTVEKYMFVPYLLAHLHPKAK